jgi:transmembrane sensor
MLDELVQALRKRMAPPWDDLRERRLLRGIERALHERRARRATWKKALSIALPAALAVAAVAALLAVGALGARRLTSRGATPVQLASAERASSPSPEQDASAPRGDDFDGAELRELSDGSRLELLQPARIEVRTETGTRVEIEQLAGRVRYQVAHVPERTFVVVARGVQVQVTGTVFVVAVDGGKVSVKVQRGRVHVTESNGEVELGAGDEFTTAADETPPLAARPPLPAVPFRAAAMPPAGALLDRADDQRRAGDLAGAAATLRSFLTRYPNEHRASLGWFTLAKVERARGRAGASAAAFQKSFALAPSGPLAEDALAEEAAAWAAAGARNEARATAARYLRLYSNGTHALRMQNILE